MSVIIAYAFATCAAFAFVVMVRELIEQHRKAKRDWWKDDDDGGDHS